MLKILGLVIATLIAIPLLFTAVYSARVYIADNFVYPGYVRRADAVNDQIFAKGLAALVEVEHRVVVAGKTYTALSRHACTERADAAPLSIKGGPYYWDGVLTSKGEPAHIDLNANASYRADITEEVCYSIRKMRRDGNSIVGAPIEEVVTGAIRIQQGQAVQKCNFPLWNGGSSYGGFTVQSPVITRVTSVPTHEVFSRSELPSIRQYTGLHPDEVKTTSEYTVNSDLGCIFDQASRGLNCVSPESLDTSACTAGAAGLGS